MGRRQPAPPCFCSSGMFGGIVGSSEKDGVQYMTAVATLAWKQHVTVEYRITSLWPDAPHYTRAISQHWSESCTPCSGIVSRRVAPYIRLLACSAGLAFVREMCGSTFFEALQA
jgi:hypothetical protein